MRITLETDYAIRIVDYLARNREIIGTVAISETVDVPLRFAKNILHKLVKNGIIISYKGLNGGYELARSPENISLYDIYEVTEGKMALNRCLIAGQCGNKLWEGNCPYYDLFSEISSDLEKRLREIPFSEIVCGRNVDDTGKL